MGLSRSAVKVTYELNVRKSFVIILKNWDEELSRKLFLYIDNMDEKFAVKGIEIANIKNESFVAVVVSYASDSQLQLLQTLKENDSVYLTS